MEKRDDEGQLSENGFGEEKDVMESTEFAVAAKFRK
jgi:hypothetical protein